MKADPTETAAGHSARLEAAFAREEYRGLRLAAHVRAIGLGVIGVWITIENPFPDVLYYYAFLALFVALAFAPLRLHDAGRYRRWMRYLFPALDVALLTYAVFSPNPFEAELLPPQHLLRVGNELFLFLVIGATVFTYSPAVVLWTGVCAALAWSAATLWLAHLPDSLGFVTPAAWQAMSPDAKVRMLLDPHRIHYGMWGRQVVVLILTASGLAAFVQRARRLVAQQADAERERANLSRYFSPNLVDELAAADQPLGPTRQQNVAVLFVDIVGFTGIAEALPPAAVIDLLRAYHGRIERLVFANAGTVDKYIGDGLMATFGTPRAGATDATNALRCARSMVDAMRAWNTERSDRTEPAIRVGIGLHYGAVVLGDIGGEARLEYAVIGDTVNVASRLERLTRAHAASIVASDALIAAVKREAPPDVSALVGDFEPAPAQTLRGRSGAIAIWQSGASVARSA